MGDKEAEPTKAEFRAKATLRSLKDLKPDTLEDLSIGAEVELANREAIEKGGLVHISELASKIGDVAKGWGKISGLSTGFTTLDARIGGLKKGEVILIAGSPGNGKSAIAANIAAHVGKTNKVVYITLEMLAEETGARLSFYNDGVEGLDVSFQEEQDFSFRSLTPLFDKMGSTDLVIIDYLQYLGRGMDHQEVAQMSQLIKKSALKYRVPIIVIVSLRKGGTGNEKRKWTQIELEDLMGTSAIGYDADIAMVVSRRDEEGKFDSDGIWVKILKVRNMPDSDQLLRYAWDKTKMSEPPEWFPRPGEIKDGALPYKD